MTEEVTYGSLFSGCGGLDLAIEDVFGATCLWQSESDPHASKVLAHHWPDVTNLGDITLIDWDTVPQVDILAGGFPCQDISGAGKGAGIEEGTRSGLWYRFADAIRVLRPRLVVVENVAALRWKDRGFDKVLGSLADLGFDARWTCLRASDVGACHRRERLFLVAWPQGSPADAGRLGRGRGSQRHLHSPGGVEAPCGDDPHRLALAARYGDYAEALTRHERAFGRPMPEPTRGSDGRRLAVPFVEWMMGMPGGWVDDVDVPVTGKMERLGNAVVPQQAAAAIRSLLPEAETMPVSTQPVMTYDPARTKNAQAITDCVRLGYIRPTDKVLDATYGLGRFWNDYQHPADLFTGCDLNPTRSPIGRSIDARQLPWVHEFDVTVIDPPYKLNGTPEGGGPASSDEDYGVEFVTRWQDRHTVMAHMLISGLVATKPGGLVLFKCMDQVVSGHIRFQTMIFAALAEGNGANLKAQLHVAGYRKQPEGRTQKNPRSNYSTLLIIQKDRR